MEADHNSVYRLRPSDLHICRWAFHISAGTCPKILEISPTQKRGPVWGSQNCCMDPSHIHRIACRIKNFKCVPFELECKHNCIAMFISKTRRQTEKGKVRGRVTPWYYWFISPKRLEDMGITPSVFKKKTQKKVRAWSNPSLHQAAGPCRMLPDVETEVLPKRLLTWNTFLESGRQVEVFAIRYDG